MCGLVGIINKNGKKVDGSLLKAMAETLSYRGPDEEGHSIDGVVGFYHKRLSIIDLVTGRQPMKSNGVTVVFNGEIYNYIELRESLKSLGILLRPSRTQRSFLSFTTNTARSLSAG